MAVPATPPHLLPGRPALAWSWLILRSMVTGFLTTLVMMFGFFVAPAPIRPAVTTAALLVGLGAGAVLMYASIRGWRMALRERNAGYTTTFGDHPNLWQLDPMTGEVLRRPGERTVRKRH